MKLLTEFLAEAFDASPEKPLRLPSSGAWKELNITAAGSGHSIYPNSTYPTLFEHLVFNCDQLILSHHGSEPEEATWRQAVADLVGEKAIGSEFGSVVFRIDGHGMYEMPDAKVMAERPAISESIRSKWDTRKVKADVPIIWKD